MIKKQRESRLLKFPEIQDKVNKILWQYIYDNNCSYTWIAEVTGLSKGRFTDLKKVESGKFIHPLSESILEPLVGRDIVLLESIEKDIDISDPKKAEWLENQRRLRIIKYLASRGYPIDEKLKEVIEELNR